MLGSACSTPAAPVTTTSPTTTEVDLGMALYDSVCSVCHGVQLRGGSLGPSLLEPSYAPDVLDDDAIVAAMTKGVEQRLWEFGPMPAAQGLSRDEIDAIIGYIRTVQATRGVGG